MGGRDVARLMTRVTEQLTKTNVHDIVIQGFIHCHAKSRMFAHTWYLVRRSRKTARRRQTKLGVPVSGAHVGRARPAVTRPITFTELRGDTVRHTPTSLSYKVPPSQYLVYSSTDAYALRTARTLMYGGRNKLLGLRQGFCFLAVLLLLWYAQTGIPMPQKQQQQQSVLVGHPFFLSFLLFLPIQSSLTRNPLQPDYIPSNVVLCRARSSSRAARSSASNAAISAASKAAAAASASWQRGRTTSKRTAIAAETARTGVSALQVGGGGGVGVGGEGHRRSARTVARVRVRVRSSVYLVVAELEKSGFLLMEQVRSCLLASSRYGIPVPGNTQTI